MSVHENLVIYFEIDENQHCFCAPLEGLFKTPSVILPTFEDDLVLVTTFRFVMTSV